jgi:hypothetical protein
MEVRPEDTDWSDWVFFFKGLPVAWLRHGFFLPMPSRTRKISGIQGGGRQGRRIVPVAGRRPVTVELLFKSAVYCGDTPRNLVRLSVCLSVLQGVKYLKGGVGSYVTQAFALGS